MLCCSGGRAPSRDGSGAGGPTAAKATRNARTAPNAACGISAALAQPPFSRLCNNACAPVAIAYRPASAPACPRAAACCEGAVVAGSAR
eukprot:5803640-Lingulodinium_polyedra.AAC.1